MAAELGQQTVEFSALVRRAAEESYLSLKELVDRSKAPEERSDSEKKIDLLKFIVKTRQRMLRLHVLAKWCQQVPLVHYCQQLAATLSSHDTCFIQTADSLFYMQEGLQHARAPIFDVPSAAEVLLTGGYQRLPKCIEDLGIQITLSKDEQKPALKKLDTVLRSKLLEVSLPKEISDVTVSDGTAVLRVDGEFKVFLTVGYRGHLSLWRILHLELLVGEKNGPIKLEETRRYALGDDLERRMAAAENPFTVLYTVLHELCVALVMDTVVRQVQVLRQGRWKDAIRFELIFDDSAGQGGNTTGVVQLAQDGELDSTGLKIPGLKIIYWLDFDKNTGGSDSGSSPFIKIEPGQDLQIKCQHSSFVLDPLTDREAKFSLDQSCIDVEKLLLRAIACNRHTRLLEIQRELSKSVHICRGSGDVILKREGAELDTDLQKRDNKCVIEDYCWDEVLRVRTYGVSYITLGINIRNGRFLLQSSKNVLAPSALLDSEEALNQGSITATEVFMSLRSKSILHLFASTGKFLGLKVYDQSSTTIKIPKSILHGPDLLLMGFPRCGNPVFTLLETQTDPGGKSHSISDANEVIRFNKIDIGQMQIVEDELNMSLFDWEKLHSLPNIGACNQISEHGLLPELGLESALQHPACSQPSFSSVVDEVFESEKGASGPPFPITSHLPVSYNMPPLSHLVSLPTSHQGIKAGVSSPKWEGVQQSQINNIVNVSAGLTSSSNSMSLSNNLKGLRCNSVTNSLPSSSPARNSSIENFSASKSDQDLSSLKSPHLAEVGRFSSMDDNQARLVHESPKELGMIDGSRPPQLLPPLRTTGPRPSVQNTSSNNFKSSSTGHLTRYLKDDQYSSSMVVQTSQTAQSGISSTSGYDGINKHERKSKKRLLSDFLTLIPLPRGLKSGTEQCKRMKILESARCHPPVSQALSSVLTCKSSGYTYGDLLAEPNHGITASNIYVSVLLHVVKHCSLCIKHAQLTGQMDALDIPYVEEVGLRTPSSSLWLRLPFIRADSWQHICLRLGKPGSMCWDVKINDPHFKELWELHEGSTTTLWGSGVRVANTSEIDSHIHYDPEGVVLSYKTVEADSIQRLISDLRRLSNARLFACGMQKLIGIKVDDKLDESNTDSETKLQSATKRTGEAADKLSEQMRKTFKIEAVGLMSVWFSYVSMPVIVHFVVEWEAGKEGCTMHVSPDQLWPHTKFLEDFVNGAEVASFLDCIRLTAGPLLALGGAIRPARMPMPVSANHSPIPKQNNFITSQGLLPNTSSSNVMQPASSAPALTAVMAQLGSHSLHSAAMLSAAGRGGPGLVPSSLLPYDVSVVLRGPYWIRIIYRKKFAVDMRCFAGDQVWLQPATPPKGGPAAGGSLPCPQFRPFIMEHVAQGLNALEPNFSGAAHAGGHLSSSNSNPSSGSQQLVPNASRLNVTASGAMARTSAVGSQVAGSLSRVSNAILASSGLASGISGVPFRVSPGPGFPAHVRGELNTAFIGLGDDGGYGGGWVPLAALKKVLRGILKYLGVLWLFAQLPDLLKEILGSILKENEGALLNLDQEQPALRFFVGGYVFAVSVHRVQLLLQVLSVRRFQHQQQQQQTQTNTQEELAPNEINEICDYFSRRVASEPYDASRVASFITLLTLPVSVLREFLKLISWKKGLSQAHSGDIATAQRARMELCLENHSGSVLDENSENFSASRSNIHHDRAHNSVDFALNFVLDPAHIPHMNAAGGAAWLPYCVSVRLKYSFGENTHISFLGMDGSHGGRACWLRFEDWEKCKQRVARTVEYANGSSAGDVSQGRLRLVAETVQRTLHVSLQQLRDGALSSSSTAT
ncbi:mediator of RNA polymerase II transcription subunit 14-like isoform X2 [Phoenix dactylifera]|uniref:Mediator of RNA polymerase II transcription subunit 14 n=1 Tax=Phoenix dactylifera TaxID=42345 RepID=A0A8B9AW56_PHODC|nr:mediator of RNA polymerase II transcription subunit 14-like isoform X2 [Phoenix dactylifera]